MGVLAVAIARKAMEDSGSSATPGCQFLTRPLGGKQGEAVSGDRHCCAVGTGPRGKQGLGMDCKDREDTVLGITWLPLPFWTHKRRV